MGAGSNSSFFYTRLKGETEEDIRKVGLKTLHIYQPSLLIGERKEQGLLEKIAVGLMPVIDPLLIGGLRKYRSIPTKTVAMAMYKQSINSDEGCIYTSIRSNKTNSVSTYISAENLGHSFHDKWLFKNVTIGINRGRRVALVGINGAGKSTLLKLLAGEFLPTEGKVVRSRDLRLGYLEQDPHFKNAVTISDYIFHADNVQQQAIRKYEELLENDPNNAKAIDKAMEELGDVDAWEYEYKIKTILGRLDIHHLNQHINTLSGGQKKRLALARLLIEDPDIYVLDEPTNHLDIDTIEWLEKLLTGGRKNNIDGYPRQVFPG